MINQPQSPTPNHRDCLPIASIFAWPTLFHDETVIFASFSCLFRRKHLPYHTRRQYKFTITTLTDCHHLERNTPDFSFTYFSYFCRRSGSASSTCTPASKVHILMVRFPYCCWWVRVRPACYVFFLSVALCLLSIFVYKRAHLDADTRCMLDANIFIRQEIGVTRPL